MTTTLRGDGVLYPDGTLQRSAATSAPIAGNGVYGIAYSATPSQVDSADYANQHDTGGIPDMIMLTPSSLFNSTIMDVGNVWTTVRRVTRTTDVTYTNATRWPIFLHVGSDYDWSKHGLSIYVNGQLVFSQLRRFGRHEGMVCAWAIIPPGATYKTVADFGTAKTLVCTEVGL